MDVAAAAPYRAGVSADDAMFREVLDLLADCSSEPEEPLTPSQPRYAIGSVARRKRALDLLRREERELTRQLATLRGRFRLHPFASAREEATKQRRKREEAERENDALRSALEKHTAFLKGLTVVYGKGPYLAVIRKLAGANSMGSVTSNLDDIIALLVSLCIQCIGPIATNFMFFLVNLVGQELGFGGCGSFRIVTATLSPSAPTKSQLSTPA